MVTFTIKYVCINLLDDILQAREETFHIAFLIRIKVSKDLKVNMSLFADMVLQNIQSNYKLLCIEKLLVGLISKFDKDAIFKAYKK